MARRGGDGGGGVAVNRGGVARGGLICILRRGNLGGDGVAARDLARLGGVGGFLFRARLAG